MRTSKYVREVRMRTRISILRPVRTSRKYLEVRMAAPVRSYCFTVEMELIGPAVLNGAPLKHDANAGT
jgi:hypothetical protein